jgi:hypothetical protein
MPSYGAMRQSKSMPSRRQTMFFSPKDKELAKKVSIENPSKFKKSIKTLEKDGLTVKERRALILAQNRAVAQLERSNLSKKERKEFNKIKNMKVPSTDSDGDGVPDSKDCAPFDKKKQGALHDFTQKILEKREERLERKREKEMKKLSDLRDKLRVRRKSIEAKTMNRNVDLAKRQAVIDEINREKKEIVTLKQQNKDAKKLLYETSFRGKVTKGIGKAVLSGARGLSKVTQQLEKGKYSL